MEVVVEDAPSELFLSCLFTMSFESRFSEFVALCGGLWDLNEPQLIAVRVRRRRINVRSEGLRKVSMIKSQMIFL